MNGISGKSKDKINSIVEEMFDRISQEFVGNIPGLQGKSQNINSKQMGLPHLYIQGMGNRAPNEIEKEALRTLLNTAHSYVESLKNKTKAIVSDRIDGLAREANARKEKLSIDKIQEAITEEMGKAKSALKTIVESEATKLRNLGSLVNISRFAADLGDTDPNCYFIVVKDGATCKECLRLHMMPDGITPRAYRMSELSHKYHKRGEDSPSAFGLHPHCFTGSQKIATDQGLVSFKELFDSQIAPKVVVDFRTVNKSMRGNQFGQLVPGNVRFDLHSKKETRLLDASPVYETGVQEVLRLTLDTGHQLEVSLGHEMWTEVGNTKWAKVPANKLVVGDKVPLLAKAEFFGQDHFPIEAELMGFLMGDGYINEKTGNASWIFFGDKIEYGQKLYSMVKEKYSAANQLDQLEIHHITEKYNVPHAEFNSSVLGRVFREEFGLSKKPRRVPGRLFKADKETVTAFLRGLFGADGHSEPNTVVIAQNDYEFLQEIQQLLSMCGIISKIYDHGEAHVSTIRYADGTEYETNRKACWRLHIGSYTLAKKFVEEIQFGVPKKQEAALSYLVPHGANRSGWMTAKIEKIESIGMQQTYCLTEHMTNTVAVNGVVTGQCRCTLTLLAPGFTFEGGRLKWHSLGYNALKAQRGE